MTKQISVIIPIYNRGYCLSRCLDSVLNQLFEDWECLLIDDGSTDNSLTICNDYAEKDARFQVLIQPENKGVSMARNRGLDMAQGRYITFIDSDDWIEPEYLSRLYESAGNKTMPLCSMIFHNQNGDVIAFREIRDITYKFDKSGIELLIKSLTNLISGPTSRLYNRAIIEEIPLRFIPQVNWGEDTVFNCEYLTHMDNIAGISTPLYHVMLQEESLSTQGNKDPLYFANQMQVWYSMKSFFEKKGLINDRINRDMEGRYVYMFKYPISHLYFLQPTLFSIKERFQYVRNIMRQLDRSIIKPEIIPKRILHLKFYMIYNRLTFLLWLYYELRLLKNKILHKQK